MQVFAIFGGIVGVFMAMKAWGYPDTEIEWNFMAVFIRNWGLLLLVIPAIWATTVIRWEEKTHDWTTRWTVLSGYLLLGLLVIFFVGVMTHARPCTLVMAHSNEQAE